MPFYPLLAVESGTIAPRLERLRETARATSATALRRMEDRIDPRHEAVELGHEFPQKHLHRLIGDMAVIGSNRRDF